MSGDATLITHDCSLTALPVCVDHLTRRHCQERAEGRRWQESACEAGQGCVRGECESGQCVDQCDLGDTRDGQSCMLYDLVSTDWVATDPVARLHDRARAYNQWVRQKGSAHGGVAGVLGRDPPVYDDIRRHVGTGDSAIFTGTYLAAEALRLLCTGSPDAREQVKTIVDTLHLWFNVDGAPGLLARFAAPAGAHPLVDMECDNQPRIHCNVVYAGTAYDYEGQISRDQYQGVMLGYALAYEALGDEDEATKAKIREDVVELLKELMLVRRVAARLTWGTTPLPETTITLRYAVLAPSEMADGAIELRVSTDFSEAEFFGFQEFIPNLGDLIAQFPGLGWATNLPRADSAIMLAAAFRVALLVTEGVEAHHADRAEILSHYHAHVDGWLDIAGLWAYLGTCGDSYYGNHIMMEALYNLARLETDPARRDKIHNSIFGVTVWPKVATHKNSFFSFIYAGTVPTVDPSIALVAGEQLAGFPPPPRVQVRVDFRADPRYPHDTICADQVSHDTAVDVSDRVNDYLWQRHPWALTSWENLDLVHPGVDYLVAYWLGRYYGFLDDDSPGRCLAWRPD